MHYLANLNIKEGWKIPEAPVCHVCKTPVKAIAYFDIEEVSFSWDECCQCCDEILDVENRNSDFDEWPFEVDCVYISDLENAGFEVV